MDNQKEYCENLYQEYLKLKSMVKNAIRLKDYHNNRPMEVDLEPPYEKMERSQDVKKELVEKCGQFLDLTPSERFEIKH